MGQAAAAMGGGVGLNFLKRDLVDKPREVEQRNLAAITALYSPWTGMSIGDVGGIPNDEGSYWDEMMKGINMGGGAMKKNPNLFGGG